MTSDKRTFGSFFIGDFEVALPIESVQEVVNYPERITPMPLAPSFFLGLFNLRGMIIPIVNLNELLQQGELTDLSEKKIAITNYQDIKIGLVFDATSEILKLSMDDLENVTYQEGSQNAIVSGILKLNHGTRLLQVIEVEKLIKLENFPHILSHVRMASGKQDEKNREKKKQAISFCVNDKKMAFPMDKILEIIKVPELEKGFVNFQYSRGLVNLRGMMIPVVDLGHFLDKSASGDSLIGKRIIILSPTPDFKLGLLIDSVEAILSYFESEVLAVPNIDPAQDGLFAGLLPENLLLLETEFFVKHREINQTVQGHAKLFQNTTTEVKKKRSHKETFISFKIDSEFCFPILEIKEVIEYPQDITRPMGAPEHLLGIYSLRGAAVTLISLKANASVENTKVIILKHNDEHVGLVVDSIENIFSVYAEDKFPCPPLMKDAMVEKMGRAIREFILLNDGDQIKNKRLVVLDSKRFFETDTYKVA